MGNKKQIIVGAADVYLGPAGTGMPAFVGGTKYRTTLAGADGSTATGVPTLVTNWKNVGYTQEGLEVSYEPDYADVQVDQLLDAAKIFKQGMTVSIRTTFAEATLDNLLIAWGQLDSTVSSVGVNEREAAIEAGSLGAAPVERGLIAIGNAPENTGNNNYGERVYHAFRVLSVESSAHSLSRNDPTVVPVSFRALPDDATARYGTIRDRLNV
jgi:hypothetical protein